MRLASVAMMRLPLLSSGKPSVPMLPVSPICGATICPNAGKAIRSVSNSGLKKSLISWPPVAGTYLREHAKDWQMVHGQGHSKLVDERIVAGALERKGEPCYRIREGVRPARQEQVDVLRRWVERAETSDRLHLWR